MDLGDENRFNEDGQQATLEVVDLSDPAPPNARTMVSEMSGYANNDALNLPNSRPSEDLVMVRELEELVEPEPPHGASNRARSRARFQASSSIRITRKLAHNALNKVEDVGIGLLGVTEGIASAGEGVGRTAVSGVDAVGSAVQAGVGSILSAEARAKSTPAYEVDTVTEVDISGTIVRDLNRAIEAEKLKGTNTADSPLNTPWILMIFPVLPLAIMYTKTVMVAILPYVMSAVFRLWTFFGWRFWFCLATLLFVGVVLAWDQVKEISAFRATLMQIDVYVIKFKAKMAAQRRRQEPKVYKSLENISPPFKALVAAVDSVLAPKLGYSPLLSFRAKYHGWKYDPTIEAIGPRSEHSQMVATTATNRTAVLKAGTTQGDIAGAAMDNSFADASPGDAATTGTGRDKAALNEAASTDGSLGRDVVDSVGRHASIQAPEESIQVLDDNRDRGHGTVVNEEGVQLRQATSVQFDASQAAMDSAALHSRPGVGDFIEQFFYVELCLKHLEELHRSYTSIWIEWIHRGLVVDRSVIRSVSESKEWKGLGSNFDDYLLTGEVRLPLRADTTLVKGGYSDVSVRLILKGRDGLPLYSNDGARRYMQDSPRIYTIGEIELSALKIGIGADSDGITRSLLRIPFHALGEENYRTGVLFASARFSPIDTSSYSYRQMLSPLPNGEWTIRVNVFELRSLKGVDASLNSDPFVQAKTLGMTKTTDRHRKTLSCMVNQLLFFSKICTGLEFEDEKIIIEVMDWNRFSAANKIGVYTIDAKRILELPGRELYRTWFALQDPQGGKRPAGFVKLSVTVVPPGCSPPQHDDTEDTEEFTNANLLKNTVLKTPRMSYQNWAVHITVGWADMLPRMATARYRDAVRGFVTCAYSGWDESTSKTNVAIAKDVIDPNIGEACRVMPQRRVIWNEEYILPLTIVNDRVSQEGIQLRLYHRVMPRLQSPFRENQLIGQVNVSFFELFKNMCTAVVRGQPADGEEPGDRIKKVAMMKPRYYNFYGMPDGPADAYDKGVSFRGRVLVGVAAKPGDVSRPFIRRCPPPPRPKLEFYKLDFSIYRATELSLPDGWTVYVECRIGLYSFGHTIPKVSVQNQCIHWDENCTVSVPNMQFPEDIEQIPDLFITLYARKPSTVTVLEEQMASGGDGNETENSHQAATERRAGVGGRVDDEQQNVADSANADGSHAAVSLASDKFSNTGNNVGDGRNAEGDNDSQNTGILPDPTMTEGDESTWQPKAFLRLTAKNLICEQTEPRWMFMDYPGNNVFDTNDTKVPGSLLVAASLSGFDPVMKPSAMEEDAGAAASGELLYLSAPRSGAGGSTEVTSDSVRFDSARVEEESSSNTSNGRQLPASAAHAAKAVGSLGLVAPLRYYRSKTTSVPFGSERSYTLRALILQGRNLPAADESGLSDPRVVVSMGNKSCPGKVYCKQTVAPRWQEMIEVKGILIREGERKPNVNVIIYDYDDDSTPMKYLGRAIIPSSELDTVDPTLKFAEWYPVFSVNPGVMVGEILADFQLLPTEAAVSRPVPQVAPSIRTQSALRISFVGLRDVKFLKFASGDIFVECCVSGGSSQPTRSKRGAILQRRAYEANCNILDVLVLDMSIPEDLRLAPALNIYVFADYNHTKKEDLIASACIPLENWLSEHERRLLTGENLIDDSFGMDTPVPSTLSSKYRFRRNARVLEKDENSTEEGAKIVQLHEIQARARSEQRQVVSLKENPDVLRIGFPTKESKRKKTKTAAKTKGNEIGAKIFAMLAPLRAIKFAVADVLADLMPDVTQALGIEVGEDVPLSALMHPDADNIDYDGTRLLKRDRGCCPHELEIDLNAPAYGEFLLFRGDNRGLGNTTGRMTEADIPSTGSSALPPFLPLDEAPSAATLKKREQRRAQLEGCRPAVGKVKARLDLVELDVHDDVDLRKVRLTSLNSFGRVFSPCEVIVRVYVLRAVNLQQVGAECNPYLTCRFYGGYPEFFSQKHNPIRDNDNPNFFELFESRVQMPGGSIRIEVKDRVLPEVSVPVAYPFFIRNDGHNAFGIVRKELPLNVGNLGLGWSELIGETVIDLDSRWYNSAWRSLRKTPVETRALLAEDSSNMKGQLELFIDVLDAKEVDKHPKLYRPLPIKRPPQETYVMRVVIYKVTDCNLPYKLANNNPSKLASLYVQVRLGNRPRDERETDRCKYVSDGIGEFNWRMKWDIELPSVDIKPRLKLQVFDDTSMGMGNDQLCAVADIKLRSVFDDIVLHKAPIIKKKQWVTLQHPNHPDVMTRVQLSMEMITAADAAKKKCNLGKDGYDKKQHPDYVLPEPFRPAAFSLYNPAPYFNYLILSMVNNIQWQVATVLLLFPFIPMSFQFVFMLTPWTWYFAGGLSGLIVFLRIMLVQSAKATRMQSERQDTKDDDADDTGT